MSVRAPLDPAAPLTRRCLDERLTETAALAWEALSDSGRLHPLAVRPRLRLPTLYRTVLADAISAEQLEQQEGWEHRVAGMTAHYLDYMPALRVELLGSTDEPAATLFHTPLDWGRLPRLATALSGLFDLLEAHDVDPGKALGVGSLAELADRCDTLGELYARTCFGGFMPPLCGYPPDMTAYGEELDSGADVMAVIDRRLAGPLLHEHAHLGADRPHALPPYMDECVAGYLGVHLMPEMAYPARGEDNGLMGASWFAQVGQSFVRSVGLRGVVRGHAGAEPWEAVLPRHLPEAIERLAAARWRADRSMHFLSGNTRPRPWCALFFLAAWGARLRDYDEEALAEVSLCDVRAGAPNALDTRMLADGLRAMCLQISGTFPTFRVMTAPPPTPILVDVLGCTISRERAPDSAEPAPPAYLLPPALAYRLKTRGRGGYTIRLSDMRALPHAVSGVLHGLKDHVEPGLELRSRPL